MNNESVGNIVRAVKQIAVATGVVASFVQSSVSAADFASKAGTCFTESFSKQDGPVKDIAVSFDVRKLAPGELSESEKTSTAVNTTSVSLEFTEWDVPNYVFASGAACTSLGEALRCQVDCDGGHAILRLAPDGRLFVDTGGMRTDVSGDVSLLMTQDADGGELNGLFALTELPKGADCSVTPDKLYVALQAGDVSDRVRDLEKKLNSLGQFLEFPDDVFDQATTDAVKAFQRQYGLEVTGVVDLKTATTLTNVANSQTGGC